MRRLLYLVALAASIGSASPTSAQTQYDWEIETTEDVYAGDAKAPTTSRSSTTKLRLVFEHTPDALKVTIESMILSVESPLGELVFDSTNEDNPGQLAPAMKGLVGTSFDIMYHKTERHVRTDKNIKALPTSKVIGALIHDPWVTPVYAAFMLVDQADESDSPESRRFNMMLTALDGAIVGDSVEIPITTSRDADTTLVKSAFDSVFERSDGVKVPGLASIKMNVEGQTESRVDHALRVVSAHKVSMESNTIMTLADGREIRNVIRHKITADRVAP